MPRNLTSACLAAIQASAVQPHILVQLTFATTTAYLWTGIGNLTWNSQTWTGLGSLLGIEIIEDGATVEARGTSISLSGLDPTILSACLTEFQLGLPVNIYLALFTAGITPSSTSTLIANPIPIWVGRTDQPIIDVDGGGASVRIACESRLLDLNVPSDFRYTTQDQQALYPNDIGLAFVDDVQEQTILWGVPLTSDNLRQSNH
jgi:hypothetical protein